MKQILLGFVAAVVLAGVVVAGFVVYVRQNQAQLSAQYLFAPTDIKNDKGQALSRVDLLDVIIRKELAREKADSNPVPEQK